MNAIQLFVFLLFSNILVGQTVRGEFTALANQPIKLEGFKGLKTYTIASASIDKYGKFQLNYTKEDYGIGYLTSSDGKSFVVILCGEDIELVGESLNIPETIEVVKGEENLWFEQYAKEHTKREQVLSAWNYLNKIYRSDSLFGKHQVPVEAIIAETNRIKEEDKLFLENLPAESFVRWFLPIRKLISDVSMVAQYRNEEIPATIEAFRKLDFTDILLYKSGLYKDAIESHFWLIENCGKSLDSVYIEMQLSIDSMLNNLVKDEDKLNEVTDYLFDLLERHSLFQASEYLAIKVLNEVSCTIDANLAKQLETYRAMKKGNTAPELFFDGDNIAKGYSADNFPRKLSDIQSEYYLIVFGASWCPKCNEELPQIVNLYQKWKNKGVEVVYISLDENKKDFVDFAGGFPFLSSCDYQKWNGKNVDSYYVFATPTMFLLDENNEILLRPNSVKQMDAWVDWNKK